MTVSDPPVDDKHAILRRLAQDADAASDTVDAYDWIEGWIEGERERLAAVWKEVSGHKGGRSFWHNVKTGERTWHRPAGVPGSDWVSHTTEDGRVFWQNHRTREKTWTGPPEALWKCYTDLKSGNPFWFNSETGQKTWTPPFRPPAANAGAPQGQGGCWERLDAGGETCWRNTETKRKQWHQPDVLLDERNKVDHTPSHLSLLCLTMLIALIGLSR
ncbi:hypothetical protein DIPPA_31917 [Diplonema papillatum]|nr:hypothetical protein DIPPA_31917 [Diplonema papillatum]